MSAIDEILRKRGHEPSRPDSGDYTGFTDSGGHPQMGFSLVRADGSVDGFFYHNLDNLDLRAVRGAEYLNFTHRGKAVTLQGVNLKPLFMAMMNHTLTTITEYDTRVADAGISGTVVTRVAVTMVSLAQETAQSVAEDHAAEMRQH